MRKARQVAVGTGRVDDDKIMRLLDSAHRVRELRIFRRFVVGDQYAAAKLDETMMRKFEMKTSFATPRPPVFKVVSEASLPAIEINSRDALAGFEQGYGNMKSYGRLPRAALLVTQHNHMGTRCRCL